MKAECVISKLGFYLFKFVVSELRDTLTFPLTNGILNKLWFFITPIGSLQDITRIKNVFSRISIISLNNM